MAGALSTEFLTDNCYSAPLPHFKQDPEPCCGPLEVVVVQFPGFQAEVVRTCRTHRPRERFIRGSVKGRRP